MNPAGSSARRELRGFVRRAPLLVMLATPVLAPAPAAEAMPRGALWAVVRACMLDSRATGSPWPCLAVDRSARIVVVGDPKRRTQVLITPTVRIPGLESPALQEAGGPNYWRAAWEARGWLDRRAGGPVPAQDVGLAVNSRPGRTQDELHVHLDCLRSSVRRSVDRRVADLGETWGELPEPLFHGHLYRARWLAEEALAAEDPFHLLAEDPAVAGGLRDWTLVMVAARRPSGERGFVLLSHRARPAAGDLGAGEELLDHGCSVLSPGA